MNHIIMGPASSALEAIRQASQRFEGGRARIAVAWARDDGVSRLFDAIGQHITRMEFIVGINERGTTVEALLRILQQQASLRVFYKHPSQTFHPKIYWFDDGAPETEQATIIVGSSNLTTGGLITNFEASLVAEIETDTISEHDRAFLRSMHAIWSSLADSPYAHTIAANDDVRLLYEAGYIECEHELRRDRRHASRRNKPSRDLPSAPPRRPPAISVAPINIPFPLRRETLGDAAGEQEDPIGTTPLPERFFVRTLTDNDVAKLRGRPGTFEPDLGEMARNRFPAFWGWPEKYAQVTRALPRREWQVKAQVISSTTPPGGVPITIVLWYREARPEHAPEHRFSPRPTGLFRQAVPPSFDTTSLLVVEQAPSDVDYQYIVRLITNNDPGYSDFATYLTEERPQHRFGYGP